MPIWKLSRTRKKRPPVVLNAGSTAHTGEQPKHKLGRNFWRKSLLRLKQHRLLNTPPMHPGWRISPKFRSEEHTSELQSIMRNSYAAIGLKNKQNNIHTLIYIH